ncbi:MAG: hypothetical protein R3296_08120 [Oleiphilaceae bacterium]|nr:hypothetical protein [Oleiphilaceae bacterium]
MQAQRHLESVDRQQAAAVARRLIDANALYATSNDGSLSPSGRKQARIQVRDILQSVLQAHPTQPDALSLLGRVEMDAGHLESAREMFVLALEVSPDSPQILTNYGYWALMAGKPETALESFDKALKQDRQSAAAFAGVAHARRQLGEFDSAYLHYRRLLDLGLEWPSVYEGMMACAEQLEIHQADSALALDAIRLLQRDELPHQNLARFVSAILRAQYSVDDQAQGWLLDSAAQDTLLLLALERSLLPDPQVEKLLTRLRATLVNEVAATGELRESLQQLALALAIYGEKTGYALFTSGKEQLFVQQLDSALMESLSSDGPSHELAGALILRSLYGALFHQPYAVHLGQAELNDWPMGMRPMMAVSHYHKVEEEAYKQNFEEKQQELALERNDLPHAWPAYSNLSHFTPQRLRDELEQSLGITPEQWPETLRILLIGAGSGQRALELARYFTDVEVVAVDEELANLAHSARRAREMNLENIVFWPYSLAGRFINDGNQVQMVELGQLPSGRVQPVSINAMVSKALVPGGVLHINTQQLTSPRVDQAIRRMVERHKLPPTAVTIQRLRRMVLNNPDQAPWSELLADPDFYATAGCRRRWFFPQDPAQISQVMGTLSNEVDWKLVRARDHDGHDLAPRPVQAQLQAQGTGSSVRSLTEHGLSLYFQRRR